MTSPSRADRACEIALQDPGEHPEVDAESLEPWLADLLAAVAPAAASFTARFVDDEEMRSLNQRYRDKDKTTDVLSFPGGDTPEGRHLGDVVISVAVAAGQTPAGEPPEQELEQELKRLLLHGVLHCLGHDHETDDGEMEALEARLREEWL